MHENIILREKNSHFRVLKRQERTLKFLSQSTETPSSAHIFIKGMYFASLNETRFKQMRENEKQEKEEAKERRDTFEIWCICI